MRTPAASPDAERGSGSLPVESTDLPTPSGPELLLMRGLATALVPLLVFGAGQASATPGDLPLASLATGPAVVLAMRCRPGQGRWAFPCLWLFLVPLLALCEGGAQSIAQPFGMDLPQRLVHALGTAVLVSVQAAFAARHVRTMWIELARDRRPPPLRRLVSTARLVGLRLLPVGLVVAVGMVALHVVVHRLGGSEVMSQPAGSLRLLGWSQFLAGSLSVLVVVPLLSWDIWALPGLRILGWILGLAAALAAILLHAPWAMWLLPAYAFLCGWCGGVSGAALGTAMCTAMLLMLDDQLASGSPFDGPDGYAVLLLTALRLCLIGLLGMVWNDPRSRAVTGRGRHDVRSGAPTFRNVMALEWHLARAGYGRGAQADRSVLWLHVDMPVNRSAGSSSILAPLSPAGTGGPEHDEPSIQMMTIGPIGRLVATPPSAAAPELETPTAHPDGLDSSLPSPRLPALMQALARGLRGNDAVVPIAGEALIVLVDNLERGSVANLIDRIDVLLLREGRQHLAPAEIRQAALVTSASATVLLTSARFLSIDL